MISYVFPIRYDLHPIAVDPSKQNPFAPKPIFPAPTMTTSLNSSVSSSSSMSASSPSPSPRTSLSKVDESPPSTGAVCVDKTDGDRNDMNNNDDAERKRTSASAEVPVRKIAGKKISALFEV